MLKLRWLFMIYQKCQHYLYHKHTFHLKKKNKKNTTLTKFFLAIRRFYS